MSEFEEDIKALIKEDGWRDPEFLWKRIMERMGGNCEDAKSVLDQIVAEDRSLRFVEVHKRGRIGQVSPDGEQPTKERIAYHRYLEPNGVYNGRKRGRPRDWMRDYQRLKNHP